MKSPFRFCASGLASALITPVVLAALALCSSAHAWQGTTPPEPEDGRAVANGASLHNPSFDNHRWYEFSHRYDHSYPAGSWIPDDDTTNGPQDWRLWFQDGTAIVECDPEDDYAHTSEGVQMRPYDWGEGSNQLAGLYQPIYNTTPCITYQFSMYGQSRPEIRDKPVVLQVGIDRVGWHPDSANDPAVHSFPSTTVWGASKSYKWSYGLVSVTTEAWDTDIAVFLYADAPGGRYHRILWDTGSFQEATQDLIADPDHPPAASGISGLSVTPGSTSATVTWNTSVPAIEQVFYRQTGGGSSTPTTPLSNTIYLPIVRCYRPWLSTTIQSSQYRTSHSQTLTGLQPGTPYEYIVASRGLSGGQCVTWVSNRSTFTTAP